MITKEDFQFFWKTHYSDIPPIGYLLRNYFFTDRWFRIHSLPDSKRYADNKSEMQTILDRQNILIDDLIGEHSYVLLFYKICENPTSAVFFEIANAIPLDNIRLDLVSPMKFEDECYLIQVIVKKKWVIGDIDNYLEKVAEEGRIISLDSDDSYTLMIIDMELNRIIAPYDSGVDIILSTNEERDIFKAKYKNWLSLNEIGL